MAMKTMHEHEQMTIGQLAKESGTDSQTIRFYERSGLLSMPKRTESNYRIYNHGAAERLRFIKRAKEIGFSLNDIKVLLDMADGRARRCASVKKFAETRLARIRSQISDLKAMERTLASLIVKCADSKSISDCPILETLTKRYK